MQEKQNIGHLFDRIAGSYDRLNHLLSLNEDKRWRRKAIRDMRPHNQVLDVAIGTGDLSIELLKQGKAQKVIGIDLSTEMMGIGKQKMEAQHLKDNVEFIHGSALDMPFEDNSFEAVTCAYGVRNFSDLDQGLREMCRVLRPGGELMILEFSYPKNRLIAFGYDIYFTYMLPYIGRILSHEKTAYTYFNRSVKGFIWGETMCKKLTENGFSKTTATPLSFGITTIYRATK